MAKLSRGFDEGNMARDLFADSPAADDYREMAKDYLRLVSGRKDTKVVPRKPDDSGLTKYDGSLFGDRVLGNMNYMSHVYGILKDWSDKPYRTADLLSKYGSEKLPDGRYSRKEGEVTPKERVGEAEIIIDEMTEKNEDHAFYVWMHEKVHDMFPGLNSEKKVDETARDILKYLSVMAPEEDVRELAYRGYMEARAALMNDYQANDIETELDFGYPARFKEGAAGDRASLAIEVAGDVGEKAEQLGAWGFTNSIRALFRNYAGIEVKPPTGLSKYLAGKAQELRQISRAEEAERKKAQEAGASK